MQEFAWELSHFLAKEFGYVDFKGKEIRVSQPDVSAYQLRIEEIDCLCMNIIKIEL